jgi:hypothetical protein
MYSRHGGPQVLLESGTRLHELLEKYISSCHTLQGIQQAGTPILCGILHGWLCVNFCVHGSPDDLQTALEAAFREDSFTFEYFCEPLQGFTGSM